MAPRAERRALKCNDPTCPSGRALANAQAATDVSKSPPAHVMQEIVQSLENRTSARISMLSRGGASAGVAGSSIAAWAEKRTRPSSAES